MTFYWLKPKGQGFTRQAVGDLDRWPTDWVDLKLAISEVMRKLQQEHEQSSALLLLERHMPGKKFIAFQNYKLNPFTYKRDFEGYFKVEYYHLTGEVYVLQAFFGFSLSFLTPQYMAIEKNRLFSVPPLIPKAYQGIGEKTRHLLLEPSGLRYIDYGRKPLTAYHDQDSKWYAHMPSYDRQPQVVVPLKGRFQEQIPPQS